MNKVGNTIIMFRDALSRRAAPPAPSRALLVLVVSVILALVALLLCSCATPPITTLGARKARVTYYAAAEDRRWRNKRADGGRIVPGKTIAMERSVPFGTPVEIPALAPVLGNSHFTVQDRGSAVESRKASHGSLPIVDVAVASIKAVNWLKAVMPPVMEVW